MPDRATRANIAAMRALLLLPLLTLAAAPAQEERRFIASGFDRVRVIGPYTVAVVSGPPGVVASGDRAALDGLTVRVESGVLVIRGPGIPLIRAADIRRLPATITVTATNLRGAAAFDGATIRLPAMRMRRIDLEADSGGTLDAEQIDAEELSVTGNGGASLTVAGTVDRLRLNGAGQGKLIADKLTTGEAELHWDSPNPLRVAVRYSAKVSNFGKGQVTVTGKPQCEVHGSGPIRCGGAPASNAKPIRSP